MKKPALGGLLFTRGAVPSAGLSVGESVADCHIANSPRMAEHGGLFVVQGVPIRRRADCRRMQMVPPSDVS